MPFYYTPWIILPLLSALVNGALASYAWPRRRVQAVGWFFLQAVGLSGWSLSYALNTAASELWLKKVMFSSGTLFACLTFFASLPMTLSVMGMVTRFPRWAILLFGFIPSLTAILGFTNHLHGFVRHSLHLVNQKGLILLGYVDSVYYNSVHLPYVYLNYLAMMLLCLYGLLRRSQLRRASLAFILLATIVPLVTDMLNLSPFKELRLTTSTFFLTGICYWLAVFRFQLLDLVPLARTTLFDQLQEPVLVVDNDDALAETNRSAIAQFNLTTASIGQSFDQLFPSGHLLHGATEADETLTRHDAATGIWWQVSVTPLKHGTQQVGRLLVLHDVTSLEQAREEVRVNAEKFRRLVDDAADVIWQLDTELRFTYINAADQAMRGFSAHEVLGTSVYTFLPEPYAKRIRQANEDRRAAEERGIKTGSARYELQMLRKDGSLLWVEVHANPLRDAQGIVSGYIGSIRDIGIQKTVEFQKSEALAFERKARAEQEQFLAMLSHEYRTPLAIIQANLDLLELQESEAVGHSDISKIASMKRAINRLVEVMGSSLQKSRMEHQGPVPDAKLIRPVDFLDEIIDSAEGLWSDRLFMFTPEPLSCAIRGNRLQLKTALLNLLDNACKYSPEQTAVSIGCSEADGVVTISVANAGAPLSKNDIASVFEKFRRGSTSHGTAGAGLGLWLVQRITEQHGGSVGISSTVETGTTVSLILPMVPDQE